jgi:DNA-binding NtrC family response regulator
MTDAPAPSFVVAATRDGEFEAHIRAELATSATGLVIVDQPTDCLDAVGVAAPVLLLLDDLGDAEGAVALLRHVRMRHPALPVIYTTGAHSRTRETLVRREGVLYYSAKPLRPGILRRLVEVMLERGVRRHGTAARAV